MPTATQTGSGAGYIPRNKFKPNTIKKVNVDDLENVSSKGMRQAAGGGPSTLCKVLTAIGTLCVVGVACGVPLAMFLGATTTTVTSTTVTTATTSTTSTSTTSTTSTSTTSTTTTTSTTSTTTTATALQALSSAAQVTYSNIYTGNGSPASQSDNLVDRSTSTAGFNTGGYAPQYVELQLTGTFTVCQVCLLVGQAPNGATHHQLWTGPTTGSLTLASDIAGYTSNGQWINLTYNPCLTSVVFLRLNTISSPSWVAWIKFLVYGV